MNESGFLMIGYWAGLIVFATVVGFTIYKMWKRIHTLAISEDKNVRPTDGAILFTFMATILIGFVFLTGATFAYSLVVDATKKKATPQPTELQMRLEEIQSHQPITPEEIREARNKQDEEQRIVPHAKALSSFEEAMQREAEKIRDRNPELQDK